MKSMNLINLMNYAWREKNNRSVSAYVQQCVNLISHAYAEICRIADQGGVSFNSDKVFYIFQDIFVFIMKGDVEFLQGEYDAYCGFCKFAGVKALSVNDVNNFYGRSSTSKVVESIIAIKSLRSRMDSTNYEAMVLGFCYLSLLGDRSFDENEYYIIRCFFESGYDYAPSDWETFKREW